MYRTLFVTHKHNSALLTVMEIKFLQFHLVLMYIELYLCDIELCNTFTNIKFCLVIKSSVK